jgi:hypothetical protein
MMHFQSFFNIDYFIHADEAAPQTFSKYLKPLNSPVTKATSFLELLR